QLALKDVALAQTELAFDIERREDLTMKNPVAKVRSEFTDCVDDRVAKGLALFIPRTTAEVVGCVLHETRHHVLARRRDRWIGQAGYDDVHVRLARKPAVLRIVVRPLHVVDAG